MNSLYLSKRFHQHSILFPIHYHASKSGVVVSRILFFILLLYGPAGHLMAQEGHSRFSAELSLGPSFPLGNFASKDNTKINAGWANPGPAVALGINYRLSDAFGLSFLLSGQENDRDHSPLISELSGQNTPSIIHTSVWPWMIGRILAGGYFMTPLSRSGKWQLRSGISAGVMKTHIPKYNWDAVFPGPPNSLSPYSPSISESARYQASSFPWTFCYSFNAGLIYKLDARFYATGNIGYFYSSPRSIYVTNPGASGSFLGIGTQLGTSGGTVSSVNPTPPQERSCPISSLNIMFGIGMKL